MCKTIFTFVLVVHFIAADVRAQCYLGRNCEGTFLPSNDAEMCQDVVLGVSYEDGSGICINFPTKFGFRETSLTGVERGEDYMVDIGFLEGRHDQAIEVTVEVIHDTTGEDDVRVTTFFRSFPPRSTTVDTVTFSLQLDSVAQEINETFTLKLNYDTSLFGLPTDTVVDELVVTIIDSDSIGMGFSENDYRAEEGFDAVAPVRISKDASRRLANPVVLKITPLTVDDALAGGIINTFAPEDDRTPLEIIRSPLRANEEDFDATAFTVTIPADEALPSAITAVDSPIPIIDDMVNEAPEQFFFARMEVIEAVNMATLNIDRDVTMVVIGDNDDIRIGFAQEVYNYFEPDIETLFTNLTIVKDGGRVSEQTFRVGISVSDPTTVTPATLRTSPSQLDWDYSLGSVPGQTFFLRDIFSPSQSSMVAFFLNGDDSVEDVEGFVLTSSSETAGGFPSFLSPLPSSTTAFQSTTVQIIDTPIFVPTTTETTTMETMTTTMETTTMETTTMETTTMETIATCPPVEGSLYFQLNGVTYPSGSSVRLTEVGFFDTATGRAAPDSSLVCITSEVNTQCCRSRDGGNVGEWLFPDGSLVPRRGGNSGADFVRSGYIHQVRLSRNNDASGPLGTYTCTVPRRDGCGGLMHTAEITLEAFSPTLPQCFCSVCVWNPPQGSFESLHGYDVRYFNTDSGNELVLSLSEREFYQVTTTEILSLGEEQQIKVQFRVRLTPTSLGPWTEAVSLC